MKGFTPTAEVRPNREAEALSAGWSEDYGPEAGVLLRGKIVEVGTFHDAGQTYVWSDFAVGALAEELNGAPLFHGGRAVGEVTAVRRDRDVLLFAGRITDPATGARLAGRRLKPLLDADLDTRSVGMRHSVFRPKNVRGIILSEDTTAQGGPNTLAETMEAMRSSYAPAIGRL